MILFIPLLLTACTKEATNVLTDTFISYQLTTSEVTTFKEGSNMVKEVLPTGNLYYMHADKGANNSIAIIIATDSLNVQKYTVPGALGKGSIIVVIAGRAYTPYNSTFSVQVDKYQGGVVSGQFWGMLNDLGTNGIPGKTITLQGAFKNIPVHY